MSKKKKKQAKKSMKALFEMQQFQPNSGDFLKNITESVWRMPNNFLLELSKFYGITITRKEAENVEKK
jgi:hypothetical protein